MAKKVEYFAIEDEIYHKTFHLLVNVKKEKFKNWLIEVHGELSEATKEQFKDSKAMMVWEYAPYYYLWIEKFDWSIEDQGVLVHELSHFADYVLNNAGISIGIENTEVKSYYLEYLFKKIYNKLKSLHPNKKKK
jgi:hypothetical protein